MHTVNKAYSVLRQEGFLKLDRRHGAIIALDIDKLRALDEMKFEMKVILAKAICKNITEEEAHEIVNEIYNEFRWLYLGKMISKKVEVVHEGKIH